MKGFGENRINDAEEKIKDFHNFQSAIDYD